MKKQTNQLVFSKSSITELSDAQTKSIHGGCQWGDSSGATVTIKITIADDGPATGDILVQY